jgi:predicted dehydrogenase
MTQPVRAILVGCGGMSRRWVEVSKVHAGLELTGFVDMNEVAARSRAADYGTEDVVIGTDLEEVISRTKPDVVFDCTVPEAHSQITVTALEHGCHVLGEKPLADSMENARRSVAAAQAAGKLYAVIQNRRYDPNIRRLARSLRAGNIGPLTTLDSDFYIGAHFGGFRDHMRHVLLLDMAIHTFDAARLLLDADPVAVYCREWNPTGSWYDHDASAVAIFEMSNGVVYTYRGSWCSEGLNTTWEADWRVIGQKGSIAWDGADGFRGESVAQSGEFRSQMQALEVGPAHEDDRTGAHEGIIHEFVECVHNGTEPETVCTDNIKSLAMVFGAIESAESGRRVEIEI